MQAVLSVLLALSAAPAAPAAPASDPTAVYALIDRVVFLPSREAPERFEVHGTFCVAEGKHGGYYRAPQRGYLAFHAGQEKKRGDSLTRWKDLERLAGKKEIVSFGSRYEGHGLVVHAATRAEGESSAYPLGWAVRTLENARYGVVAGLAALPRPLSPADGAPVACGDERRPAVQVTLTAGTCLEPEEGDRYLFEIERPCGEIKASPPIEAADGKASWRVVLALSPGEEVVWRVRVLRDSLDVTPVASARFVAANEG